MHTIVNYSICTKTKQDQIWANSIWNCHQRQDYGPIGTESYLKLFKLSTEFGLSVKVHTLGQYTVLGTYVLDLKFI